MKIHVEVYIASRLLSQEQGTFTLGELVERVHDLFDDMSQGVQTYGSSGAVANAPKNLYVVYNYLWRIGHGLYRCFDPSRDTPLPARAHARREPLPEDVLAQYHHLLTGTAHSTTSSPEIVAAVRPTPQLPKADQHAPDDVEWKRLAALYDLERYLFEVVSPRFQRDRTLSARDFFAIIIWKSNRTKTRIAQGLRAAGATPEELLRQVGLEEEGLRQVRILKRIKGIGLSIASAILTVCYPDKFTVLDYRAWETLQAISVPGLPARKPSTPARYVDYCDACALFADGLGLSLRDLDRALWARSWEEDLSSLVDREGLS